MLKRVLLLYNMESPLWRKSIEDLCAKKEVEIHYMLPEEYDMPLGIAAYGSEKDRAEYLRSNKGKEFDEPMMVFSGFPGESLFTFMKELRSAGIGTSDLKAVMTEHNAVWDSLYLYEELRKEHIYMKKKAEELRRQKAAEAEKNR